MPDCLFTFLTAPMNPRPPLPVNCPPNHPPEIDEHSGGSRAGTECAASFPPRHTPLPPPPPPRCQPPCPPLHSSNSNAGALYTGHTQSTAPVTPCHPLRRPLCHLMCHPGDEQRRGKRGRLAPAGGKTCSARVRRNRRGGVCRRRSGPRSGRPPFLGSCCPGDHNWGWARSGIGFLRGAR